MWFGLGGAMAMPRAVDPLVVGRVIGDVVDMFVPTKPLTLHYGDTQISNGVEITPVAAADKPRLHISGSSDTSNHLYTLVMVDPDAPSPTNPTYREWLHWLVTDIPDGSDVNQGKEVVGYMGPSPPSGEHRYVLVVFKQKGGMALESKPARVEHRRFFSTRSFASEHELGLPVAALYFHSRKQPVAND